MAKPTPLSGFPELLPEQRFVEQVEEERVRRALAADARLLPVAGQHHDVVAQG